MITVSMVTNCTPPFPCLKKMTKKKKKKKKIKKNHCAPLTTPHPKTNLSAASRTNWGGRGGEGSGGERVIGWWGQEMEQLQFLVNDICDLFIALTGSHGGEGKIRSIFLLGEHNIFA